MTQAPRSSSKIGARYHRVVRKLPGHRGEAMAALGVAAKAAVLNRALPAPRPTREQRQRWKAQVQRRAIKARDTIEARKLPMVSPGVAIGAPLTKVAPFDGVWESPSVTGSGTRVRSAYELGDGEDVVYGPDLIDELNAEYADKPIVPEPPVYDSDTLDSSAQRRLTWVHNLIDIKDKRTLEIGCGNGFEVWAAARNFGADAHGVDVTEYGPWSDLSGHNVDLRMVDLGVENPFEPASFDRIMSFTVWEHVAHPYALLEQAYRLLRPGGLMLLRVNLFAGPQASHRYRDIFFPWPHLLFSDGVVREWDQRNGRRPIGIHWVNRLAWRHYEAYFALLGFKLRHVKYDQVPLDEPFYQRFEHVLGQYPRWDLQTDYFTAVLERPADSAT